MRRSRSQGVTCRVTLKKGDSSFVGEAEGLESQRFRVEFAAKAALRPWASETDATGVLGLEGCKVINAFDHDFVFVGITARFERETRIAYRNGGGEGEYGDRGGVGGVGRDQPVGGVQREIAGTVAGAGVARRDDALARGEDPTEDHTHQQT